MVPAKSLPRLASTAGLLTALLSGTSSACAQGKPSEGRPHSYYFSMAGKRRVFIEDGVKDVEVVVPNDKSEGRYNVITATWLSTFSVPPHFHKTHAETFYVLDGTVEWTVGGETRVMKTGDAIYIPPYTVHSIRVLGGKELKSMMIYSPGGYEDANDFKMNYTETELKDPKVRDRIRAMGDFNLAK